MSSVTQSDRRFTLTNRSNNEKYELWSVAIIAALVAVVYATCLEIIGLMLQLIHSGIYHFPIIIV